MPERLIEYPQDMALKMMREMHLHTTLDVTHDLLVMRVPGGWIYIQHECRTNDFGNVEWRVATETFVPEPPKSRSI